MRWIFFIVFSFACNFLFAQKQFKVDSMLVEKRLFNGNDIRQLKTDKAFQYDRYVEPPKSLWDRFWGWFWYQVDQLLSTKGGRTTMWTVFIILGVAVLTYFVLKVMGMNKSSFFGRRNFNDLNYTISSEDIHGISFDQAIEEAITSSNFRLAIRLLYLQSLKKLSDSNYITWQLNKTNTDYLQETSQRKWHPVFSSLTYNFEYTWYGESQVDREKFISVQQQFIQFNKQL
jgi:hypothetical protein